MWHPELGGALLRMSDAEGTVWTLGIIAIIECGHILHDHCSQKIVSCFKECAVLCDRAKQGSATALVLRSGEEAGFLQ
jgi:hypothetical protein